MIIIIIIKLWNMKFIVTPNVVGAWNSLQRLVKEISELKIRGRIETIQITPLLRSVRILRRVMEIQGK